MSHHDHEHHDHEHEHDGTTHSHPHIHDHGHAGDHHHHDHEPAQMPFPEKMRKLLDHWIKHNDDHASTYQGWANQARQHQLARVAVLIEEAAAMSLAVNERFAQAKALIDGK